MLASQSPGRVPSGEYGPPFGLDTLSFDLRSVGPKDAHFQSTPLRWSGDPKGQHCESTPFTWVPSGGKHSCYHGSNGHPCTAMWRSYSSRYCFTVATTGLVAKSPSAQSTLPEISPDSESSRSRSAGAPRPASIRDRLLNSHDVPSRHGVHLPHDSWRKNSSISAAARTMHVSSSSTISDAEPSIEPAACTES